CQKKRNGCTCPSLAQTPVLALLPPSRAGDDASATDAVIDSHICACGWVERGLCKMQHSSGRCEECAELACSWLNQEVPENSFVELEHTTECRKQNMAANLTSIFTVRMRFVHGIEFTIHAWVTQENMLLIDHNHEEKPGETTSM
ncbi:unnamed protein product, partial [Aureobasidium pullulans]